MLINRLSEMNDRGTGNGDRTDDHDQEYQTASELFDMMAKDHQLNVTESLTASDLVLLYKNLDVDTNILPESVMMNRRPNQHVETVVYEDDQDSEDSDISYIGDTEDIDVYECNKERLDLLNNRPSLKNTLCQKLGGIEIKSSNLKTEYHQHLNFFQDTYIRDQLNYNFGLEEFDGAVLPATLLDYICCKRLEDNYNFYIDNIIRYVKHTIEQLKRISNGDYLTDRAKEKWREVSDPVDQSNSTKILATSTSIPLLIERKTSKHITAWDDIVHSEVDVRSLSKILEKKIIVEVPKLICGTYKLFSRRCADNLIISCKREKDPAIQEEKQEDSRVDVVLQLEKSQSGQVVSNISSIMILKAQPEICVTDPLPLPYKNTEDSILDTADNNLENKIHIEELDHHGNENDKSSSTIKVKSSSELKNNYNSPHEDHALKETNDVLKDIPSHSSLNSKRKTMFTHEDMTINETRLPLQSSTTLDSLPDELIEDVPSNTVDKKKSPSRIRIKSPYENESYILEEKKRRRLLEIREKREKKKIALNESCKISKHKYGRGGLMPQASNSVTKLSITNKSFYNSIYGQSAANDPPKNTTRKGGQNDSIPEVPLDHEGDYDAVHLENKKYINRSYYLDDAETEIMYMEMKKNENNDTKACSASTSVVSSDFRANLSLLSQLIGPSVTDLNVKLNQSSNEKTSLSHETNIPDIKEKMETKSLATSQSIVNFAPANTPKNESEGDVNDPKKTSSTVECRKSIEKIYDLMKKLEKGDGVEDTVQKYKPIMTHSDRLNFIGRRVSSTIQGSDSGTSLKHHLTSSNPSCFSFEKPITDIPNLKAKNKKLEVPVVPKVIISNKAQVQKTDVERMKRSKRSVVSPTVKPQDNPLKAISQLLHEFDNVQKCRQKTGGAKSNKKHDVNKLLDIPNNAKGNSYQGLSKRRSQLELHLKETDTDKTPKVISPRKLRTSLGFARMPRQQVIVEDHHDKVTKRKITDIIDEVKEARGEAVKGPSKLRLNSLAQPKKSYVQARIEEHPNRAVKALSDRQTKLATAALPSERNAGSANSKTKAKRTGAEAISSVSVKQPPVQPLDKAVRMRRSANSSPDERPQSPVSTSKPINVPPTPESLKKMVAVESYVKNHYRRTPPSPVRERPPVAGHKSRIPLLPQDIELASLTSANTAEESTDVGSKLHDMISTMLDIPPGLTALSEDIEDYENIKTVDDLCRSDEKGSVDSDYPVDVFEDKHIVTAVEHVPRRATAHQITEDDVQVFKSTTEIQMLENSLCRKWPGGSFQKRLRIKNLTLTPKHSTTQVFLLQSGDDGSLVIKSSVSKMMNLDDKITGLKTLPVLSKTELDWNFTNLPMHIATVGYAFPKYQSPFKTSSKTKLHDEVNDTANTLNLDVNSPENTKMHDNHLNEEPQEKPISNYNEVKPSVPTLNTKPEEENKDLINSFVAAIAKSYENSETRSETNITSVQTSPKPIQKSELKNIDYTTSLDMLVGLLNEIQKITSCQTHITNSDANEQQCRELETILDDAAALEEISKENPRELVSIASLDRLRKLESNPSIYTLYLSSDEENDKDYNKTLANITTDDYHPLYIDKEVNVDLGSRECISRFTEVPSTFPINVNRSTNVTNSLIGVLSQPSSQSMFSYMEYQTLYSNTSFNAYKNIIQLSQPVKEESKETAQKHVVAVCKEKQNLNGNSDVTLHSQPCPITRKKVNKKLIRCKQVVKQESVVSDFDPILKMKRDILVTVYSILVFTVFAALSFPEVLYPI